MQNDRNADVLRRIISYCTDISEAIQRFGKDYTVGIPWTQIKALRNVVAHNYGKIDDESLWETITSDILKLKDYCTRIIQQLDVLT